MAAILAAGFVGFALIARVARQLATTGDHGIRLAQPGRNPTAAIAGAVFVMTFASSLILISLDATNALTLARVPEVHSTQAWLAMAIGSTGIAITVVAQWQMQANWRIGVDPEETTELVTTGLFSKSRNPIYFGILLYWLGIAGTLPNPIIWTIAAVNWMSIETIVRRVEEPYLETLHGDAFREYQARTNRYLIVRPSR